MDKSKVLISENEGLFTTIDRELNNYVNALNEVVEKYPALELGETTADVAEVIRSPLGGKTIETQYWDTLKAQLDKSGVTNKVLRNTVLNGSKDPIESVVTAHRKAHSLPITYRDTLRHIVFNESSFELQDGYAENIAEQYTREYLSDPSEKAFLQTVQKLHSAITDYRAELKKVEANHYIGRSFAQLDNIFKPLPNGDWIVDPARAVWFHRGAKRNQNAGSAKRPL